MSKEGKSQRASFFGFFDVRAWSSYDLMRDTTLYLLRGASRLFIPRKGGEVKSLDSVMKELSLSEEQIESKKKSFFRLALLMGLVSFLTFLYTMFQLMYAHYHAVLLSSVVCLLSLALTFRYHFWYFQLQQRKLGCTFKEWVRVGLLGADK